MYPSRFRYAAPRSLTEALDLLNSGDDAKVLAGGQSLVPMLKLRFASPEILIDINNLPGLDYHREDPDGSLRIGSLCRHHMLEYSTLLPGKYPTMAEAAPLIADPIVRSRGTLVGSLCHADPQGDWAAVMLSLGGEVTAAGPGGNRTIPVSEFVTGPFQNALMPGEIAIEARVPPPKGTRFGRYLKLERRVGDFATAGTAVSIELSRGTVVHAGIALTGVGAATINATDAAATLLGKPLDPELIAQAADQAAAAANPKSDHRGSADFKRHIVRTFVSRALTSTSEERAA